jgi:hypothetical protein
MPKSPDMEAWAKREELHCSLAADPLAVGHVEVREWKTP